MEYRALPGSPRASGPAATAFGLQDAAHPGEGRRQVTYMLEHLVGDDDVERARLEGQVTFLRNVANGTGLQQLVAKAPDLACRLASAFVVDVATHAINASASEHG